MAAELAIADTFADAKIAHYTGADSFVRNGAFATCGVNYTDLGKKTADLAYQAATEGYGNMDDYYLMDGGIVTVNSDTAKKLGAEIAKRAKKAKITKVVFDRGGYLYHGRVEALADSARENGLEF